jgi:hypothetical protein
MWCGLFYFVILNEVKNLFGFRFTAASWALRFAQNDKPRIGRIILNPPRLFLPHPIGALRITRPTWLTPQRVIPSAAMNLTLSRGDRLGLRMTEVFGGLVATP